MTELLFTIPKEPPLTSLDLPGIGGTIGPSPEDFRVDEIPAYTPSGQGEHRYVRVEKRSLTTPEMVNLIAKAAGVRDREIGYAGLKDKHAVTTQWLSLPLRSTSPEAWKLPEQVRVLEEGRHNNKIRTGHLRGNRFNIRLVETEPQASERLPALLGRLHGGLYNAFGEQRFGISGANLPRAMAWLSERRQLTGGRARFLEKLYASVIQSELFNRYLWLRKEVGWSTLIEGEYVRLAGQGGNFLVESVEAEQPRYERGELFLQGPMFGPKMRPAKRLAAELEQVVLSELAITSDQLDWLSEHAPGTRRDLWLLPSELALSLDSEGGVRVEVALDAGAYATELLRELTRHPWLGGRGPQKQSTES